MTPRPLTILTVCLGNICRSPTAEAAIRQAADDAGVALTVRSAGTGSWHLGAPPDARMRAAGAEVGLGIDGVAARVEADAMTEADLILAMDRSNLAELQRVAASDDIDTPIVLFREFDPDAAPGAEVPDPYYGGADGFAEVVAICRRTAGTLVDALADGGVAGALARRGAARS
ncbi:MAG: low molecular weight protein-tyrosine-phosphatase [Nitriliruptoraceae bacterium]